METTDFIDAAKIQPEEFFIDCNTAEISAKESLGILKLEQLNASFANDLPNTGNSFQSSKNYSNNTLNTAFLLPVTSQLYPSISTISISSVSHFNSCSLEANEPSTILSPKCDSLLNKGFVNNNSKIRFSSVNVADVCDRVNYVERASAPEPLPVDDELEVGDDNVFDDSVFVEANHLVSKLGDWSSLIGDNCVQQTSIDCISPPKLVEAEGDPKEDNPFEAKDPVNQPEKEFKEKLDDIFNKSRRRSSSSSSDSSNRYPKELLTSLYSIINNEQRDTKQNEEGQQLLLSLANVLCESKNDSFEDSLSNDDPLDLRINKSDSGNALDLSMKSSTSENRRLSQSFTFSSQQKMNKSQNSSRTDTGSKLKPMKFEDKLKKIVKGPIKAIIPVMDMAKRKSVDGKKTTRNFTPPKFQSSLFQTKTSTPINEPQLKPMAQSTPGVMLPSKLSRLKSPLNRDNSSLNSTRSSQSASTPNLSNQSGSFIPSSKFMYRRHSATELKSTEAKVGLARSYSIGASNKQVVMNKLKPTAALTTKCASQSNPKTVSNESKRVGLIKNMKSNLIGKMKKNKDGKENLRKK